MTKEDDAALLRNHTAHGGNTVDGVYGVPLPLADVQFDPARFSAQHGGIKGVFEPRYIAEGRQAVDEIHAAGLNRRKPGGGLNRFVPQGDRAYVVDRKYRCIERVDQFDHLFRIGLQGS